MKNRLLVAAVILATALLVGRFAFSAHAAATDFRIVALDCANQPGHITIQNQSTAAAAFGLLSVQITSPGGAAATPISVNAQITPSNLYQVSGNGSVDLQVGQGATQSPNPASPPTAPNAVALTTNKLLVPGATVQLLDGAGNPVGDPISCPLTGAAVRIVSPNGFDFVDQQQTIPNSDCGPDLPPNTPPTIINPGPCLTIDNAIRFSNDGDTVFVEFGYYEICRTIELNKLVRVTTRASALKGLTFFGATLAAGDAVSGAVLHSFTGDTIFHVTAQGFPSGGSPNNFPNDVPNNLQPNTHLFFVNHAAIDGLSLGGAFKPGAAAIFLDNDSYTDVANDWIGGDPITNPAYTGVPCAQPQPFPPIPPNPGFNPPPVLKSVSMSNASGIILSNSNHANLFNLAITGSSDFKYSPALAIGDVLSGFGIVTSECLGTGPDSSNGATIGFSTISRQINAGIWLCSDGSGGHLIGSDTIRGNGRGVVLRGVTGTLLDADIISDSYQDGVVIYDASSGNTIQKSVIESQRTPGAAGIRLGGFGGSLFPLQTEINNNTIRRNSVGILIAGARSTTGTGNFITSEDTRTAVLLQTGSPGSPNVTQPTGTQLNFNQILANGSCGASQGCAIRLDKFVTSDIDAGNNSFGLSLRTDVNSVLWHKPNDPTLGFISASQPNAVPAIVAPSPGAGAPGAPGGGLVILASPPAAAAAPGPVAPAQNAGAGPVSPLPVFANPPATATPATATPGPGLSQPATGQPGAGTAGTSNTSPVLANGAAGGATTYTPPCFLITVPSTIGTSITSGRYLSLFQPASAIFSAWKFSNATHVFQSIYFSDPNAPVDAVLLRPGDVVSICITNNVQGPP